ncbi:MAG: acylphosphatase [Phycisphaerales bacterium]|jgi:acylphosphatase|nr:acylphosphatase [Phycisphaerales bacterium]
MLRFTGRVQGVGFRATARSIARRHPVTGWVRNEADGTVLMEIQGGPLAVVACLDELIDTMTDNITHVDRTPLQDLPGELTFDIRR